MEPTKSLNFKILFSDNFYKFLNSKYQKYIQVNYLMQVENSAITSKNHKPYT